MSSRVSVRPVLLQLSPMKPPQGRLVCALHGMSCSSREFLPRLGAHRAALLPSDPGNGNL